MQIEAQLRINLADVLKCSASARPDSLCILDGDRRLTYAEMQQKADDVASGLQSLGLGKGDAVALWLPNCPEFLAAKFGIARMGGVMVGMNPRYREREAAAILGSSEAQAIITAPELDGFDYGASLASMGASLPKLKTIIMVGECETAMSWDDLLSAGRAHNFEPVAVDPERDPCALVYTSGTTGQPKGAILTHINQVATAANVVDALELTFTDKMLGAVPLFHAFGMAPATDSTIMAGAATIMMRAFNAEEALKIIEGEKITVQHAVPTMVILEILALECQPYDVSSLRTGQVGGAPVPAGLAIRARDAMGWEFANTLGLTECMCVSIVRAGSDERVRDTTSGTFLKYIEGKVVDEDGRELPPGEVGELCCRGPSVISGYFIAAGVIEERLDAEGWLRTGDMASLDEDGNLSVVARKKEVVIRGGYNIYPEELEHILMEHAGVGDCAVIGLPDEVLGEKVCACVVPGEGNIPALEELVAHCRNSGVADYKKPDVLHVIEQVPRTPVGKIQRVILRDEVVKTLSKGS